MKRSLIPSNQDRQILLAKPLSLRLFSVIGTLAILLVLLFITFFEYTRKEHVYGIVTFGQGVVKIQAPIAGIVSKLHVKEGDIVAPGDPIYTVTGEKTSSNNEQIYAGMYRQLELKKEFISQERSRLTALFEEDKNGLTGKIKSLEKSSTEISNQIEIQTKQVALSKSVYERFENLVSQGFAPTFQREERQQKYLEQVAVLHRLTREQSELRQQILDLHTELKRLPLKFNNQISSLETSNASLTQESLGNESRREQIIKASQAGKITAILAKEGQAVLEGEILTSTVPQDAELEVLLYVPSRAIGFLTPGANVLIRYESYPYQKFGQYSGTIKEISSTTVGANELKLAAPAEANYYLIRVELTQQHVIAYGRKMPLQDGMKVEADVLVDTRKLYEWLLEPLYSAKGHLSTQVQPGAPL